MKLEFTPATVLSVIGVVFAVAFLIVAIFRPQSLDWLLDPSDERSAHVKREMERKKGDAPQSSSPPQFNRPEEERDRGGTSPPPLPAEPAPLEQLMPGPQTRPGCISREQILRVIGASEEASEGRVVSLGVTPDGSRILVAYRKKTILGIGSGENQIEGILRRGLKDRFPDRMIRSVKVRSDGKQSVQRGEQNISAEVLEIETMQAGCQWP
jgi:hypothetical protein